MKILGLGTYPMVRPVTAGQQRLLAMARAYRAASIHMRHCAVYDCNQWGPDDVGRWDLPFDTERSSHRAELAPSDDLRSGFFAAEDEAAFAQIAAIADRFDPQAIQLTQPWCWPVVERLLARSRRPRPQIIYSAHNVEGPLRWSLLADLPRREPICRLVETIEAAVVGAADLVLAVTSADAEAFRSMGARAVHVLENGVDPRPLVPTALARWRTQLGPEPFALFVGTGHPPNATGFMNVLGPTLAFLPPDRKIVVVGSVAGRLASAADFRHWEGINRSRIRFTGTIAEIDLAALLALAQVIILPITSGGGSNQKTAEALYSGRYVVGTTFSFKGFERFAELPGIYHHDDPADFKRRLVELLEAPLPDNGNAALRRELLWSATLQGLPARVQQLQRGA